MPSLSDGAREVLIDLERATDPGPSPVGADTIDATEAAARAATDAALKRAFLIPPAPFELDTTAEPEPEPGPSATDRAWKAGYDAARDETDQEVRDLEYTINRLECMLADARAELLGRGR